MVHKSRKFRNWEIDQKVEKQHADTGAAVLKTEKQPAAAIMLTFVIEIDKTSGKKNELANNSNQ